MTRSLLESLVGSWTSCFLLHRRCLSLLDIAFEALRWTVDGDVIRISDALRDEIMSWVIVSPLLVANLRAPVLDTVFATDASDDLLACVAAPLPAPVADEAYRHALQTGAWARLLSGPPQEHELPEASCFTPHLL